jgi:hypothetical protein
MVDHPVLVRGGGIGTKGTAPSILARSDQEFIPGILDELKSEGGRTALAGHLASHRDRAGMLRLFQPVHRVFHVVLIDVACDVFGQPRLDASRIESAGLVVRRAGESGRGMGRLEGWMQAGSKVRGWVPLADGAAESLDPDPARRPAEYRSGNSAINHRLAEILGGREPLEERVSPLFVAPPEVCRAAGRTLLYGLVPVTSTERSEAPPEPASYPESVVRELLPGLLRRGDERSIPFAGQVVRATSADAVQLQGFSSDLQTLVADFDIFGESAPSQALRSRLRAISLLYPGDATGPADEFLLRATRVLLNREESTEVRMPLAWPAVSERFEREFTREARTVLEARLASVSPPEGRFDELARSFRLRGFVRVKSENGCPPKLVWSEYSELFGIVPWYESSDVPPVRVALPDTSLDALKRLRPNVAFVMPEELFRRIQGSKLSGLLEGKSGRGPAIGMDWICAFSIPIITLCAFIVLNLFLALFNIIFFWLPYAKVWIPFPRSRGQG